MKRTTIIVAGMVAMLLLAFGGVLLMTFRKKEPPKVELRLDRIHDQPPAPPAPADPSDVRTPLPVSEFVGPVRPASVPPPAAATAAPAKRPATTPTSTTIRVTPGAATKPAPTAAPPAATLPATPTSPSRPTSVSQPVSVFRPPLPKPLPMLPPTLRSDHYVPGNSYGWTVFDVSVDEPLIIRAAGIVRAGADIAEPNGLPASTYERDLGPARSDSTQHQRVLATAPYLALIGRVCARRSCSPPFLVGTSTVVCPSRLGVTGQLQLWTNNYVRINGTQTVANFSRVSGGFTFISETAPTEICNGQPALAGRAGAMIALESGGTLKGPQFKVSSRQSVWKPFFLPLDKPILIRATGEMAPRNDALTTGPDGIVVPPTSRWIYPGTTDIVVDSQQSLFEPSLPYQALIGRFCSPTECGRPFLVGSERVLCPTAPHTDRLELWYNHIIRPPTMLGRASLTFDAFDTQSRSGEYRFEVSRASEGLCAAR